MRTLQVSGEDALGGWEMCIRDSAYDVKRGKPNPDPYLMGLQKAGNLKPWEGIVVENAPLAATPEKSTSPMQMAMT